MNVYPSQLRLAVLVCVLCVSTVPRCVEASDEVLFQVLHPPDKALFGGAGLVDVVIELKQPVDLTVRLNGKPLENPKVKEKFYHYAGQLEFGLNQLEVEVGRGAKSLRKETRDLFFFAQIAGVGAIPPGFTRKSFHLNGSKNQPCVSCHELEPQEADLTPSSPAASSCHLCHKRLTRFKQVHGPASVWSCLGCHDQKSAPARYGTPVPVRDLCYGCHTDQKEYFFSTKYQHGPTSTGMCTICHNPHASDNEYWLKKDPWDLCTTCHMEKASGRHVLAWGPSGNTHPTRGRPDPMKPQREFSCRSCHNPHASNAPKLWNFNVTSYFQLCQTCHNK